MSELKPFPDREKYGGKEGRADAIAKITDGWQAMSEMWLYEQARADAWEARARLAVDALEKIATEDVDTTGHPTEYGGVWAPVAKKALSAIGPLPKEQT